jgi:hypothetical protein
MLSLFLPFEEYVGPTVLTVGVLYFVFLLSCMLTFSLEFVCLPFVEHDLSTVIGMLEFELYLPSDRRLSAKLMTTFADRECPWLAQRISTAVFSVFLDRSRYSIFQVAPQLSSRGWVDPVPDPLLLRKSGSPGNRTRVLWICSQKLWPLDHRGGRFATIKIKIFNLFVSNKINIANKDQKRVFHSVTISPHFLGSS